jgi:glycine cleavage system H protein
VDLPKPGTLVQKNKTIGSVESVKAVIDIYTPVSGEVV